MAKYVFDPQSIAKLRTRLSIKQDAMAKQLGVTKALLSQWETGKREPSISTLADIYAVGVEEGRPPEFFIRSDPTSKKRTQEKQDQPPTPIRTTAFGYWDMQNVAPGKNTAKQRDAFIRSAIKKRSQGATMHLNAYCSINQSKAAEQIEGWTIKKGDKNWDEAIKTQVLRNTRQSPTAKIVFLITVDKGYTSLIKGLQERGILVYLIATSKVSKKLREAVGKDCLITLPRALS